MRSLRIDGGTDEQFTSRAKRAAVYARVLVDACLQNECVRDYIADANWPLWTEEACRTNPTVRVEFEQAIAIGGIGECLQATNSKNWGDGPYIHPLRLDDELFPYRITYVHRENSLYNRRFQQRRRMKELLGKRHRSLVSHAKSKYTTKAIFLEGLTKDQSAAIWRILKCSPGEFWQAVRGRRFLRLPDRPEQTYFDFMADDP